MGKKVHRVTVMLDDDELAAITEQAKLEGLKPGAYLRRAGLGDALEWGSEKPEKALRQTVQQPHRTGKQRRAPVPEQHRTARARIRIRDSKPGQGGS